MFNNRKKKNYLELTFRVSYDEKNDSVHITSKDERLPEDNGGFHLTLSGGRNAEMALRAMLEDEGIIPEDKTLPKTVAYEHVAESRWDQFPLGKAGGAETVYWEPNISPNMLLVGPTGSGKSVNERNLIFHCLQHPDKWRIYGVDLMRVELAPYKKYSPVVERIATTLEDTVAMFRFLRDEMNRRYERMEELVETNYQDLPDAPPAALILIDEAAVVFTRSRITTEEGKEEDRLKGEAAMLLQEISRLGRAAGIHVVLATQRPDANILTGELNHNLTTRIVAGRVDSIPSQIVFGHEEATRLPFKIKGRGYIQQLDEKRPFQAAFAPWDWYDKRLEKNGTEKPID